MKRPWAFWRRVQYGTGLGLFWVLVGTGVYFAYFQTDPTCFDGAMNGAERGIDCGGACVRICAFDVIQPSVVWAQSFEVRDGVYNAVAYIENRNTAAASPQVPYTLTLYDEAGLIAEKTGTTILPPDSVYPVFEATIATNGRQPTNTFLELGEIELWVPASTGRNQFTLQNRSLSGVDSRPRLDATMYNNSIERAENVEVVATIFDAQGNALTASRTFVEDFPPRSTADIVFTWPQPIAGTIRSCEIPTDIALAIDLSGSMNNDGDTPPEPITSVLQAASRFVSRLQAGDQAAVVTFATEAALVSPLSSAIDEIESKVSQLSIDPAEERGNTNTGDALTVAGEELQSARHNDEARRVLVMLTDGLATAPGDDPEVYALAAAEAVKAQGTDVYAIGLGENVNMNFVRQLATDPSQAYAALSTSDIDRIYQQITAALCEDGPAIIEIVPKTAAGFSSLR